MCHIPPASALSDCRECARSIAQLLHYEVMTMTLMQVLKHCGAALVWVSHDDSQPSRVGGRILQLPLGSQVAAEP